MRSKVTDTWRTLPEFDNHEFVIAITDVPSGLKGFIAIHSSRLGPAHGGTRMKEYLNETDALKDALNLSRAMSCKSALAGLPYGGAKGVIMLTPSTDKQAVLQAYAKKVEQLNGLFHTGTDVGLQDDDVLFMSQFSKRMLGVKKREGTDLSTSKAAAKGVYYAMKTAAGYVFGSDDLRGKKIGIKGVGKLGHALVELLHADGASLVIADTDTSKTTALKERFGDITVVPSDDIASYELDIYSPCAMGEEFTPENIDTIKCKLIVGGANNQLASLATGDGLFDRGITYVPDYIANAGGLIFVSEELESNGFDAVRMQSRLEHIGEVVDELFRAARQRQKATHRVAEEIARIKLEGNTL